MDIHDLNGDGKVTLEEEMIVMEAEERFIETGSFEEFEHVIDEGDPDCDRLNEEDE